MKRKKSTERIPENGAKEDGQEGWTNKSFLMFESDHDRFVMINSWLEALVCIDLHKHRRSFLMT